VFTESLPRDGYTCCNIYIYACVRACACVPSYTPLFKIIINYIKYLPPQYLFEALNKTESGKVSYVICSSCIQGSAR
jgi:hypothetical protein